MKKVRMLTQKCHTCGKEFSVIGGDWGYTISDLTEHKKKYFCSYSCLRKYEIPLIKKAALPKQRRTYVSQKRTSAV